MRTALALVGTFALVAAAGVSATTVPNVAQLVLRPSQVGPGFVRPPGTDGRGVKNQVTLNLCGYDYPSESRRLTRLQTAYLHPSQTAGISNEVVTYKGDGAAQAMREVAQHADNCPFRLMGKPGEPKLRFKITRIYDSHLLKGYVAVRVVASGVVSGQHVAQISYSVYQRRGNVLSGVYSFDTANSDALQRRLCLHAAEQSALNLRNASLPGAPTA